MGVDFRLYALTSGTDRRAVQVAAQVAAGGAGVVQVRAKDATTRQLLSLTIEVARAVASANPRTRVLVNDRADVAWAARRAGATVHGVHLGADDLPPPDARALLGPEALIGATAGSLSAVAAANSLAGVVDYLGCGPLRHTPTKDTGRTPLGIEGYFHLVGATELPIIAIGDVQSDDISLLAAAGVKGVAMLRALNDAPDPGAVARSVLAAWSAQAREIARGV
ncbi:thiamine phosphate synthase [Aestuariimicrobium kwangyangense]|uniref:thiamine phosphate synthase n=1 Tax=Aestuariimicrobium kwangyangense TaxID=396389 RepID=UPI0003B62CD3|nr:thiamine phosphate synthase [Aestuariimicrobium kwangyangense]